MKFLLDTNACICYLNYPDNPIRRRMASLTPADVGICAVVKAELYYGMNKSRLKTKTLERLEDFFSILKSLPFDDNAAQIYGKIRADLEAAGTPIGPNDLLIASIALANRVTLVTHNIREFVRVKNLEIDDWQTD